MRAYISEIRKISRVRRSYKQRNTCDSIKITLLIKLPSSKHRKKLRKMIRFSNL